MVNTCIAEGCDNMQKKHQTTIFHRIPKDKQRRRLWLAALGIRARTSVEKINRYRVCEEHFKPEDYEQKMTLLRLKNTAVPSVFDTEVERSASSMVLPDTGEVMDGTPGEVRGTGNPSDVSETCAASTEKPTLQHIVDEEAILQLMKNCPMCDRKCRCNKRTQGPYFIVYQSCYFCNYQRKWANQPEARNMNIYNANKPKPRKPKPKDKTSVNAKAQTSQTNKTDSSGL